MQKLMCFLFIMVFICNAKIYEDIKNGFSINIPKDWQLIESKNENVILKCATLSKLQLNANFNVTKSKIPETLSLDDFYHSITEAQERMFPKYKPSIPQKITINGLQAIRFTASYAMGAKDILSELIFFKAGENGYLLTFTYDIGDGAKVKPFVEMILHSFKLNKNNHSIK